MLVKNKTTNKLPSSALNRSGVGGLLATGVPTTRNHDSVSVSFGSGEKNKPKRTWKQYFSDLYTSIKNKLCNFINTIKLFFTGKPAKTQNHSDSSIKNANPSKKISNEECLDYDSMDRPARSKKMKEFRVRRSNGELFTEFSEVEQRFILASIKEDLNHSNPKLVDIGKTRANYFEIPEEEVEKLRH